jgi:hypothetical protein
VRPLALAAATTTALAAVVLLPASSSAEDAAVPGELSTTAVNTTRLDVPVPAGVTPRAISGVLTMPEVVDDGVVTFRVNGRVAQSVPSALYAKVRIPVTAADVIADGTIGLTVSSQGPAIQDLCRPAAGEASFRKVVLVYGGTEQPPTTLATFFPPASAGIDVVIADEADDELLEAGIAAVAALSSRYPAGTDIRLTPASEAEPTGVASERVVVIAEGRPGEITTDVTAEPDGVPTLTIAAVGEDLGDAARALALPQGGDTLQLADDPDAEGLTGQIGQREPDLELSLADAGAAELALSGYGTTSQLVTLPQDAFSSPVSSIAVHLEGAHSAVPDPDRARLDVRMNGELVGSKVLDETGALEMDFTVPAGRLRSVNELQLVLSALTPDGLPCAAPGSPPIEVDLDTQGSTLTAEAGATGTRGFQLFPQVFRSSVPVAIRAEGAGRFAGAQDASRLISTLQRAAAYPLDVQLVPADAFIADDRSGVIVGATSADATSLEAPLKLSSIRLLDQQDSSFEVASQEPYAVLESIEVDDRHVLMLGGWSPGDEAAPRLLSSKVVGFLETAGWASLDGDLLLTDESAEPFTVDSRTLEQEQTVAEEEDERSYARWFVAGVALLLLLLAFQVVVSVRRDRRRPRPDEAPDEAHDDALDESAGQPAYLEDLEFGEQHPPHEPDEPEPPVTAPPATEAPATKAPATKAPATEAPAKKVPAKKTPAKKVPAKKTPAKKATPTPRTTPQGTQRSRNAKKR